MAAGKILVIRGGALGDFILTLPVLRALRENFPAARLEALGSPQFAELAVAGGLADAVQPIESRGLAGFFARGGTLDAGWRECFAGCAVIVSYLYDPDGIFQENVARVSRANFIAGPHRPAETGGRHATEVLLQPLERLAVFSADATPRLTLPQNNSSQTPAVPTLALHPGSGSPLKNWPEENWAELLQLLLNESPARVLLLGGEAEGDRLERLARPLSAARCEILRQRPLTEVAQRLAPCAGFIGHDSGPTHLAAALGLPVFALWGPSVAAVWRPLGPRVEILPLRNGLRAAEVCARLLAGLRA